MRYADARSGGWREGLALPLVVVIAVGAAYEAAVALGWVPLGDAPGEGPRFGSVFYAAALLAMVIGAPLSWVLAAKGRASIPASLLAVAAVAFMVAAYNGFDPYYLPTLRRYSDDGSFPPAWVYTIAAAGLAASALCFLGRRFGLVLTGPVLLFCAFTSLFLGVGH